MLYSADFETTTNPDNCHVWAWGVSPIEYDRFQYGSDIESFISFMEAHIGTYYFHNLKFDGTFIVDYLLRNNYRWTNEKRMLTHNFTTLIADTGMWYSIRIQFENGCVEIRDSLKILPMKIEEMPKAFGFDIQKLEIDYKEERNEEHILTEKEIAYLQNDVLILAHALKFMYDNGQKKLTTGANGLYDYKQRITTKQFKYWFPKLDPDTYADVKKSYKGGFTYLNPKYRNAQIGEGSVFDVNSMYPWAMKYCPLPHGKPLYFEGEYRQSLLYDLYIQCLTCEFTLKPGRVPSIQIKNNFRYAENEYLSESDGPTILYLTSVDLKLFFDNYDVIVHSYNGGYAFMSRVGMFDEYIDYWYGVKNQSKKDHNPAMNRLAKLMLNALYGKFGAKAKGRSKIPYLHPEKDCVAFYYSEDEERTPGYNPVATFITSYCRDKIIRGAISCGDRFIYADTDSLHITGTEPPEGLDVDEYRLGAFKLEETFTSGIFVRQKTYMELVSEKWDIKCAGMPANVKASVKPEEFKTGSEWSGKLMPKIVPGGVILKETTFKIK